MEVTSIKTGLFETNTYLLSEGDDVMLIDPASKAEKLFPLLEGKKLLAVLLTHGHLDHIKAVDGLYGKYHMPIYVNKQDEELLHDKTQGYPFGIDNSPVVNSPVNYLQEGKMNIGPFNFEVLFTPGHTKGSTCFIFDKELFSGDTLFKMSAGRTDLKGGDYSDLKHSLQLLKNLGKDYIVYPGHDESTTLSFEVENNPYM